MNDLFILLGTNIGDRLDILYKTIHEIDSEIGPIKNHSSVYETSAWGLTNQPDFLNMVIKTESDLLPADLLTIVKSIEKQLGRKKTIKWGPREIDVDILYYGDVYSSEELTIPHKGIPDRRFTLIPLVEIVPDFIHPITKMSNQEMLNQTKDQTEVKLFLSKSDIKDQIPLPDGGSF